MRSEWEGVADAARERERGRRVTGGEGSRPGHPDVAGDRYPVQRPVGPAAAAERLHHEIDDRGRRPSRGEPEHGTASARAPAHHGEHHGGRKGKPRIVGGTRDLRQASVEGRGLRLLRSPRTARRRSGRRPPAIGPAWRHRDRRASRPRPDPMSRHRLAAIAALLLGFGGFVAAGVIAVQEFPRGLGVLACIAVGVAGFFYGILRVGLARLAGASVGILGLAAAIVLLRNDGLLDELLIVGSLVLSCACVRVAFGARTRLPAAPPPLHPVLFFNPKSGGGKAERFHLAAEARRRSIEPIELKAGDDLEVLARAAVGRGADGLAMAGGDGSQAVIAAIAAETDLPYACVPAGTRNHFALDLGVDRDDVVGALEAFVDGGERRVDLAEVNGRVFVNNVSLGPLCRSRSARGIPRGEAQDAARHRARGARAGGDRPRSALERARRSRAPVGCGDPRLQQPLPARPGGRLGNPSANRRRSSRHHRRRSPDRPGPQRPVAAATVAGVVLSRVRGRFRSSGPGRHRRRSGEARRTPSFPHPAGGPQGPHREGTSWSLALGDVARHPPRGGACPPQGRARARATLRTGSAASSLPTDPTKEES